MRIVMYLLLGTMAAVPVVAAPLPQLSFERGNTVLFNPGPEDIVLRSANIDRVRLQLFALPDDKAENQIVAARIQKNVTENGLLGRVLATQPRWQSDFIVSDDGDEASTQLVPLMAAAGLLPSGDYVLMASSGTVQVAQWFTVTPIAIAARIEGKNVFTVVVDLPGLAPVPDAVVVALNARGEIIGGARTNEFGAAHWELPAETVVLRGEKDMSGGQRTHSFLPMTSAPPATPKTKGGSIAITPDFTDAAAAGATARFSVTALDDEGRPQAALLHYSFIQESYKYEWQYDDVRNWQYRTIARPSTLQRGTVRTSGDTAAQLALPVGEGRYQLAVTGDGARAVYKFTAGWWRMISVPVISCAKAEGKVTCSK